MGQLLRSVRESSGASWLGGTAEGSADCITEFAEQQIAALLASQGGLGLSKLIIEGLERAGPEPQPTATRIGRTEGDGSS